MLKFLKMGLLGVMVVLPASAAAQFDPGATVVTLNVNYATGKIESNENRYDGWGFSGTFEKMLTDNQWSVAFTAAWLTSSLTNTDNVSGATVQTDISTVPVFISGRYNTGNRSVRAYLGLGLGMAAAWVNTSVLDTNGLQSYSTKTDPGVAMAIPLGLWIRLSDKAYVNINYTPYFAFRNDIIDGATHILSLGFTFPD